jgi:hypothetical protein
MGVGQEYAPALSVKGRLKGWGANASMREAWEAALAEARLDDGDHVAPARIRYASPAPRR